MAAKKQVDGGNAGHALIEVEFVAISFDAKLVGKAFPSQSVKGH